MSQRALIVVDVQNEYVTGKLPIEFPDVRKSLENIGRAIDAARRHRVPVVVVQNTAPAGAPIFVKGTPGWELHEVVAKREWDHYVEKSLPSAFAGTDLASWIAKHGIDTLSVIGYMTHNCVDSTIKHAVHAGLQVECLSDATGSVSYANRAGVAAAEAIHGAFMVVMQSRFSAVVQTAEWIELLETGRAAERDTIYGSHRKFIRAS